MNKNIFSIFLLLLLTIFMLSGCRRVEDIGLSRYECIHKYAKQYGDQQLPKIEKYELKEVYETDKDVHEEILNLIEWEENKYVEISDSFEPQESFWESIAYLKLNYYEREQVCDYLKQYKHTQHVELGSITNDYLQAILDRNTSIPTGEKVEIYNAYKYISTRRDCSEALILERMNEYRILDEASSLISMVSVNECKDDQGNTTYSASMSTKTMSILFPEEMEETAAYFVDMDFDFASKQMYELYVEHYKQALLYLSYIGKKSQYKEQISACKKSMKENKKKLDEGYYDNTYSNQYKNKGGTSSGSSSSKHKGSSDYDIEQYYEDNSDIYDSYDDAVDGFYDEDYEDREDYD